MHSTDVNLSVISSHFRCSSSGSCGEKRGSCTNRRTVAIERIHNGHLEHTTVLSANLFVIKKTQGLSCEATSVRVTRANTLFEQWSSYRLQAVISN